MRAAIERMNASVAHRGPDDEGSWLSENFAFGMRRLSIIDLNGGHQPSRPQYQAVMRGSLSGVYQ